WADFAWLAASPLLAALLLAVLRWPSARQAALTADTRLGLEERLGTAVELAGRLRSRTAGGGRFDHLQVREAVARARTAPYAGLVVDLNTRREMLLAAAVTVLACVA